MCGRFGLFAPREAIEDRYDAAFAFDYEPRYNVAPEGPGIAAVRNEAPDEIDRLRWGLVPHWVDGPDDFPTLINARAETVAEKSSFRDAFAERRCLVPASNFYEWTGRRGTRVPFSIGVADRELFSMAGLWESRSANGDELRSVAIVTTEANDVVGELHDRMPVILEPDEEAWWLEGAEPDELGSVLDPYPSARTFGYEVSTAVNDPTNEGPRLVDPASDGQAGLDEFT